MKAIFGVFCRETDDHTLSVFKKMQSVITSGKTDHSHLWGGASIGLGQISNSTSPFVNNTTPLQLATANTFTFIAAGRLDNAAELCCLLSIPESEHTAISDHEVMRLAYDRWGNDCSARMYGDWVFASWNQRERQIVLARSHHGNVPLYYYVDQKIFAFATSRQALLALNLAPIELDELYLAQYLISWPAYYGEQTPHKSIKCLSPAHCLVVTQNSCIAHRYWYPENLPELQFSRIEEYVEAFLPIFDEAVNCRLRSNKPIAVTLSGGLDSGSVAASAARLLADKGQRLTAFTSVPIFDTLRYHSTLFGDEFPFAKATADYSENIDLHPVNSTEISPIQAINQVIQMGFLPCHGASNLFWLMDIQRAARLSGCSVLLTGAMGNGGISWTGDIFSQPWSFLLSHFAWRKVLHLSGNRLKQKVKSALPLSLFAAMQQRRLEQREWYRSSAIHPQFAQRIRLLEQRLHDPSERPAVSLMDQRTQILRLGRSIAGAYEAELGVMHGIEIRDPTADARVLAFTLSIPDHVFIDSKTGIDRWLIREAMKGRLPDKVRLNRKRGLQAVDLVPRLRTTVEDVENTLDTLAHGPAVAYVDVDYMRQVWRMIQAEDTNEALRKSITVLARGIMAGLFVNRFYE